MKIWDHGGLVIVTSVFGAIVLLAVLVAMTLIARFMWRLGRAQLGVLRSVKADGFIDWLWKLNVLNVHLIFRQADAARDMLEPSGHQHLEAFLFLRRQLLIGLLGLFALGLLVSLFIWIFARP